jgi:hypothetical protein
MRSKVPRRWAASSAFVAAVVVGWAAAPAVAGETVTEKTVERQVAFTEPSCVESETVVLTGTVRQRFKITVDSSGGIHVDDYYSAHGSGSGFDVLTDPGLLTPVAKYTASEEQLQSTNIPFGTFETNVVFNTRVIRQGETVAADDLYLVTRTHITINANGVPVVDRVEERLECR